MSKSIIMKKDMIPIILDSVKESQSLKIIIQ